MNTSIQTAKLKIIDINGGTKQSCLKAFIFNFTPNDVKIKIHSFSTLGHKYADKMQILKVL